MQVGSISRFSVVIKCSLFALSKISLNGSARVLQPDILCKEALEDTRKELAWRFTPSIAVSFWPDQCFEWFLRHRKVMKCKKTGMKYQWPSAAHRVSVRQLGCNIVPLGFKHPKKTIVNEDSDIEWELRFTKAEKLITRNFQHPKFRIYIFLQLIYKEYLEKINGKSLRTEYF